LAYSLYRGIVCMILSFAILTRYQCVMDGQTHNDDIALCVKSPFCIGKYNSLQKHFVSLD